MGTTWSYENWMTNIPDETKLSTLSIPGTHDTMTSHAESVFFIGCKGTLSLRRQCLTQNWNLTTQLMNGIRFIDIRIYQKLHRIAPHEPLQNGPYNINHGIFHLDVTLIDVLNDLRMFLSVHNKETVSK